MPRELADVLHHFFPGAEARSRSDHEAAAPEPASYEPFDSRLAPHEGPPGPGETSTPVHPPDDDPRARAAASLQIVAVPIAHDDAVRGALLWNLCVEVARHGGRSVLLRPEPSEGEAGWPPPGRQPLGAEIVACPAGDLDALYRAAVEISVSRSGTPPTGLVFAPFPPAWLAAPGGGAALLRWNLLLSTCEPADLRTTYARARQILAARPEARLGVTIHGARSRRAAESALGSLARVMRARLARDLTSYGLLVDDLHVYRAVAAQRPIGLTHPQSLAARALHDVAGLLLEDARYSVAQRSNER